MSVGPVARVAATLVAGFGLGFAGGHAVERPDAQRATAFATGAVGMPRALSMPPSETRVLSLGDLAHVELADRDGRPFTLAEATGAVSVVAFATEPCAGLCRAGIDGLLEARRRVSGRPADGDAATDAAPVEFVVVSGASERLPGAVAAPGSTAADGARWRVGRAGAREIAALRERLGIAAPPDAARAERPTVQLFDASGALVQRYRADPLDVARLVDEVVWLRDRGG